MSIFVCASCYGYADSDDGCTETEDGLGLVCLECADMEVMYGDNEPINPNGDEDARQDR